MLGHVVHAEDRGAMGCRGEVGGERGDEAGFDRGSREFAEQGLA